MRTLGPGIVVLLSVFGCPGKDTPEGEGSTGSSGSSEAMGVTTTAPGEESSSSATSATSEPADTGGSASTGGTTGPAPGPCEACADDEICVQVLDQHTCGGVLDELNVRCEPNPFGCVDSDPCSTECHDICGTLECTWGAVQDCASEPGLLHCASDKGQPAWACDLWAQDDCVAGKKCVPVSDVVDDWPECVPIEEDADAIDEACEATGDGDSCEAGSFCLGVCVALCIGSPAAPDCADEGNTCAVVNGGALPLCLPRCDPLEPTCADGEVCIPAPEGEREFFCTVDASGDSGQASTPCVDLNACDPGLLCREAVEVSAACGGGSCCTPVCDLGVAPMCPEMDQECVAVYPPGEAPAGYEDVGFCGTPI